ncbi:MAG: FAD-dependent oxidoreductase [Planctomycetota bacterium]|nr:FAD-dependent oxidoreductase [Planctomycetota bacterium]
MSNTLGSSSSRRAFLQVALASAAVPSLAQGAETSPARPDRFLEPACELPLHKDADVIVCGGGPAGVAAAIAAARAGVRTRLFEVHGCLGGVWTAGLLTYIFDFDKPGLTRELTQQLDERDARRHKNPSRFVYEPETLKVLLEELCDAAGVRTQLHTRVAAAHREGNRLTTIVTESKSGREAWRARVFIDATGDGDLGAQAGCEWEIGQGHDCPCQPLTLNALAVVRDHAALGEYISFYRDDRRHLPAVEAFRREIARAGQEASYGHPTLFHIRDNLVLVMINHEYGVKPFDAAQVTAATLRARAEVQRIVRALARLGGPWAGMQVVASAEQIGVRDGRRIRGRYTITRDDLVNGARHPDAVARATFNVDIHAATRDENRKETISHGNFKMQPYDIPLRALIAKDVDCLMLAGRCISGDFLAHASYRVTGNAVAMGEAAGRVAALAAKTNRLPHEVQWSEMQ